MKSFVAVIVLNYNDYITTTKLVNGIKNYENIDNIVIVDNNSTDNSYEMLDKLRNEKIDLIRTKSNRGYASGNNYGIKYVISKYHTQYIFVANPDIEIEKEVIDSLVDESKNLQNCGVVTCKMISTSDIHIPIAWRLPTFGDCVLENLLILRKVFGNNEYPNEYFVDNVCEVDVVPGSFFMIPSSVFLDVGGFDENTFLYYEENILAHKIKNNGYKNYLVCNKSYLHLHSVSINKSISSVKKRLQIAFQSRKYYCYNYLNIGLIKKLILNATFYIGLFDYVLALKLTRTKR